MMKKLTVLMILITAGFFTAEATIIKQVPVEKPTVLRTGSDVFNVGWWVGGPVTLGEIGAMITTKNDGLRIDAFTYSGQAIVSIIWLTGGWIGSGEHYALQLGDMLMISSLTLTHSMTLAWQETPVSYPLNWRIADLDAGNVTLSGVLSVDNDFGINSNTYNLFSQIGMTSSAIAVTYTAGEFQAITAGGNAGATLVGVNGHAEDNGAATTGKIYGVKGNASDGVLNYGGHFTGVGGGTAYGVYGTASGASTNWAGYFRGKTMTYYPLTSNTGTGNTAITAIINTSTNQDDSIVAVSGSANGANITGGGTTGVRGEALNLVAGGQGGFFSARTDSNNTTLYGTYGWGSVQGGATGCTNYGLKYYASAGVTNYGGWLESQNATGSGYGAYGRANNGAVGYGGYFESVGTGTTHYGIYAIATGATTNIAGYFSGDVKVTGAITQAISNTDVSNPPLDAELDAAFGTPATVGAGWTTYIDDAGLGANFYRVASDGTNWWIFTGTKAL